VGPNLVASSSFFFHCNTVRDVWRCRSNVFENQTVKDTGDITYHGINLAVTEIVGHADEMCT
jgi:hypothetical protein